MLYADNNPFGFISFEEKEKESISKEFNDKLLYIEELLLTKKLCFVPRLQFCIEYVSSNYMRDESLYFWVDEMSVDKGDGIIETDYSSLLNECENIINDGGKPSITLVVWYYDKNSGSYEEYHTYDFVDVMMFFGIKDPNDEFAYPMYLKLEDDFDDLSEDECTGGIDHIGETLREFLSSVSIRLDAPKEEVDKALKECHIKIAD